MYKVKKKAYKISDEFNNTMNLDYLITSESHYINRKHYKINRTRESESIPDNVPSDVKDLLASLHDDEDYDN